MRVNFNVINQKNVPALQSGTVLPSAGQIGRIFYNSEGIGMYIDNGTEWLPINTGGSGVVPTLTEVTNAGNITDQPIRFRNDGSLKSINYGGAGDGDTDFFLPNSAGTLVVSVNETIADANGNVTIPVPASTNFANTDLTFNFSRTHNLQNFRLQLNAFVAQIRSQFVQQSQYIELGFINNGTNRGSNFVVGDSNGTDALISAVANNFNSNLVAGFLAESNGKFKIYATNGITLNNELNTGDAGTMLTSQGNNAAPQWRYPAGYLYRSALTQIGESVNLIPSTTRPVQRLIFRGTTSISGSTFIPLTGINIGLIINLYGNIEISPDFRTPLNYFDYYEADGDSYRTKAVLYYRSSVNGLLIVATSGIIGSESSIVSAYTVVIEFQQV